MGVVRLVSCLLLVAVVRSVPVAPHGTHLKLPGIAVSSSVDVKEERVASTILDAVSTVSNGASPVSDGASPVSDAILPISEEEAKDSFSTTSSSPSFMDKAISSSNPLSLDMKNPANKSPDQLMNENMSSNILSLPAYHHSDNLINLEAKHTDNKEMLIAVVSAPMHFAARQAIRETYQKDARQTGRVQVKFFVGLLPLDTPDREKLEHQITSEPDMVQFADFTESYHNLSSKALDIFHYAHRSGYRSIFKADDDSYVRVFELLKFWDENNNDPYLYGGAFVDGKGAMVDDPKSKWYMKDQYPFDRLEDYANGPGVLLGGRALEFFHHEYSHLFRYRVDDAAIAIWLKDIPMEKKQMFVDDYSYSIHPNSVYITPANPQEMNTIHQGKPVTLKVCGDTCLCHGGPTKDTKDCITWETFSVASYTDLVPRLALIQMLASASI